MHRTEIKKARTNRQQGAALSVGLPARKIDTCLRETNQPISAVQVGSAQQENWNRKNLGRGTSGQRALLEHGNENPTTKVSRENTVH
jgi:hypothetical protein